MIEHKFRNNCLKSMLPCACVGKFVIAVFLMESKLPFSAAADIFNDSCSKYF